MTQSFTPLKGFAERFAAFSEIGSTGDGGVDRMEATPANGAARRQLVDWLKADGFDVRVDAVGNIFGLLHLAGPEAPFILAGSHIDSQPNGGRFDGAYGVLAAMQAAHHVRDTLQAENRVPNVNLAVVAFSGEEGARFLTFMGSKVYAGSATAEETLSQEDTDGVTARAALEAIGFLGSDEAPPHPLAFVELHVECGGTLEASGARLGVFERWWGAHKLDIRFIGETSHTGPTPMADRRDALYAAAGMIRGVRELGDAAPVGDLHTSVAKLVVEPNSRNVVPDSALGYVEIRSPKPEVMAENVEKLMNIVKDSAAGAKVSYEVVRDDLRRPGTFDKELGALAVKLAGELGETPKFISTLPGHDAITLSPVTRALMLAVPSRSGLCHHPDEWTDMADLELGAVWLASVLETLVREPPTART